MHNGHSIVESVPAQLACSALNAAPDAMLIVDHVGVVRFANRKVADLLGNLPDGFIGKSLDQLIPQRFLSIGTGPEEELVEKRHAHLNGTAADLMVRRGDGTEFPVAFCWMPIGDVDDSRVIVIRNVADQRQVESALVEAHVEADRANLVKSRFLATASHDLRQPVQTLAFLNGILRRTVTDPETLDAISQQEQAIGVMSRLLNSLLDISKLESGGVKPERSDFAVAAVFDGLHRDFARFAQSKGIALQIEECVHWAHSDSSLVEQILRNILANAIKYTAEGSVRMSCRREQTRVCIEVLDTGVGIPADQLRYIYDEFYQVGVETNRPRDGFGLGLSIVRRLVTLLNLGLEVHSEVGRGSTFTLEVPAGVPQAHTPRVHAEPRAAPRPCAEGPRILLVEDDAAVRDATSMLLKVAGYRVCATSSIEEALRSARENPGLDLLITDYHLCNGKKGTEVIEALRGSFDASMRAVIITGDTSSAVNDLPRDPHLRITSKPVRADELLALLRELLST